MPSTAAHQPRWALSSRRTLRSAARPLGCSEPGKATRPSGRDDLTLESPRPAGLMHRSLSCSVGSELSVGASPHRRS
ncbi:hypothetical protein J2S71_001537 [Olsenella profusa DSM 13989]|uniref:hypothetical protein n=1 Tax=Olsenella profusa TaxID=138595 RepID=UPI0027820BB9|nr:hypothetical protein [Olsenella profusa]MDP9859841.1 hypothetical protein [Olsenella profusa DSM 13989]